LLLTAYCSNEEYNRLAVQAIQVCS
jgi:hypothetical protein